MANRIYEAQLSANSRFTAQFAESTQPPQVKFTRTNRDGEAVMWVPVSLIWDLMRDTFRERLHKRIEHLFLKDFFL